MCPRGDLNPGNGKISLITDLNSKTGEESPDRGFHLAMVAGAPRLASSGLRPAEAVAPRPTRGRESPAGVTEGSGRAGTQHSMSARRRAARSASALVFAPTSAELPDLLDAHGPASNFCSGQIADVGICIFCTCLHVA